MNTTEIFNSMIQNDISNNCNLGENDYRIKDGENTLLKKQGAGVYYIYPNCICFKKSLNRNLWRRAREQ